MESHGEGLESSHCYIPDDGILFFCRLVSTYIRTPVHSRTTNCSSCFIVILTVSSLLLLLQARPWSYVLRVDRCGRWYARRTKQIAEESPQTGPCVCGAINVNTLVKSLIDPRAS